jgi:hypothetical protein
MNDDPMLANALKSLNQFNPEFVFLNGSRGRGYNTSDCDYEVGVIFDDDNKYVQRADIRVTVTDPNVKASSR